MLEDLATDAQTCGGENCDRDLPADATLVFRDEAGERRAYDCACGAVTITAVRDGHR